LEYTGDFKISSLGDEILLVGGILWSIPETSKFRAMGDEILLVGGILWSIPETSKFRAMGDEILLVGGILWSIPETSKFRAMGNEILLVGGIPLGNRAGCATSEQALYRLLRSLLRNRSALMPLLLKVNWRKVP